MKTYAYAWLIKANDDPFGAWELCRWAQPTAEQLRAYSAKPTPHALLVRVEIVPTNKKVQKLLRPANQSKKKVREYREHQERARDRLAT